MVDTYATNPVNLRPNVIKVLARELPTIIVIAVVVSIIFVPLGMFVWRWLYLGLLLIPIAAWLIVTGTSRLLRLGACCPAKVLSLDPPRLAIYSDMSMRPDACHPAIIVKECSLSGFAGGPAKVGDRLAVAAFYASGDEQFPHERWATLSVIEPVAAFTNDLQTIRRTMESIEDEEWNQLDAGAHRAQPPYDEGIYFLEAGQKLGGAGVTEGRVFLHSSDDPEMKKVQALARKTFRFFLRELSWEKRRIIPGLEVAAVKVAFSDPPNIKSQDPTDLDTEYMWINDVDFDGRMVSGVLLNEPESLQSVRAGDHVSVAPKQVVDWLYSVMGEVCGGFTVQLMRKQMGRRELAQHDEAWGLEFGEPGSVKLVPADFLSDEAANKKVKLPELDGMFIQGDFKEIERVEHPMSVNARSMIEESLNESPEMLYEEDDAGLPLLHSLTIAGSLDGVDACLARGADPNQTSGNGLTPVQLAKGLGWKKVLARLEQAAANG